MDQATGEIHELAKKNSTDIRAAQSKSIKYLL